MAATNHDALTSTFSDIANAIRGKNGEEVTYAPVEMAAAIDSIVTPEPIAFRATGLIGEELTGNTATPYTFTVTFEQPIERFEEYYEEDAANNHLGIYLGDFLTGISTKNTWSAFSPITKAYSYFTCNNNRLDYGATNGTTRQRQIIAKVYATYAQFEFMFRNNSSTATTPSVPPSDLQVPYDIVFVDAQTPSAVKQEALGGA